MSEKTKLLSQQLASSKPTFIDFSPTWSTVGIAMAIQGSCLQVLDFGGACGHHFFIANAIFGHKVTFQWHVVETEQMVEAARNLENDHLKFFDSMPAALEAMDRVDMVFSRGALQYTPNPLKKLHELLDCGAEHLFMTRLGLSMLDHDTITIQTSQLRDNGPGAFPPGF